ncbi:MAG TPA: DUF481 domain-containing protein, partial [Xanthomonadales bacterium]|nr:DUF481 domain-containing protein [Xanthomonadales bacterium]
MKALCLAVFLLLCMQLPAMAAPKTDVVRLKNGDKVTGEIKSLLKGQLELLTDHMGTILIEWEQVDEVVSNTGQSIELTDGTRLFGALQKPDTQNIVRINTTEGTVGVASDDIIYMYPVEAGFWGRLDLSARLGFSWDKSSKVGKYSVGLDSKWRDPRFLTRANFQTDITTQERIDDSQRTVFNLNHMRFLQNKRFRGVFGNLESNDELGIELRTLAGAGYGWIPVRSQRTLLTLMAGLAVNREHPDEGDVEAQLEAVGTLIWDYYLFAYPERNISLNFSVFPSLTDSGRYRANLDTVMKIELFKDLFFDITAYASYDNRPVSLFRSARRRNCTSKLRCRKEC